MSTTPNLLVAMLVLSGSATLVAQTPPVPDPPSTTGQVLEELVATQNFERSVAEYVVLHQMLERDDPPMSVTRDVGEILGAVRALAARIQVVRVTARQGDIITPEVAGMFRRRIAACLTPGQWRALFADRARDEEGEPRYSIGPPRSVRPRLANCLTPGCRPSAVPNQRWAMRSRSISNLSSICNTASGWPERVSISRTDWPGWKAANS